MSERLESKELDRQEENRKIEEADRILKKEGKEDGTDKKDPNKDVADIASKAGSSLYLDISTTRKESWVSGGVSEKTEFQDKAKPFLAKYEAEVQQASEIKDPDDRKTALEKAYNSLSEELEGIKGTQEGRDAQSDRHRNRDEKKTAEDKDRERTLKFSDAILKAAKEIEVERRLADIRRTVEERMKLAERTQAESMASNMHARESIRNLS